MQTFIANEFISLKLEGDKTEIYINDKRFNQCKYLLISLPVQELDDWEEYKSMDEIIKISENGKGEQHADGLSGEEAFVGHCSNIQAWIENDYDYKVLDSKLSIPIILQILKSLLRKREEFRNFFMKVVKTLDEFVSERLKNKYTYDRFRHLKGVVCRVKNNYFSDEEISGSVLLTMIRDEYLGQYLAEKLARKERYKKVGQFNRWEAKIWGTGPENLARRRFLRAIRSDDPHTRNRMSVSDRIDYLPYLYAKGKFHQAGSISLLYLEDSTLIIRDENGIYWIDITHHDRGKDYGYSRY